MRESVLHISPICRLLTLLLILLVCFVDAAKVTSYSPFRDIGKNWFQKSGESSLARRSGYSPFREPSNTSLQNSGEPSIVRRYYLWNRCTRKFVRIRKAGKKGVDARGKKAGDRYTSLVVSSIGQKGKILIQGEESHLYLCFSKRGKLRARHSVKPTCEFYHNITSEAYDQFRLVANEQWFIGFKGKGKRRGRPLPGYRKRPGMEKCFDFWLRPAKTQETSVNGPYDFDKSDFDPEEPKLIDKKRSRKHRIRHRKSRRRKKFRTTR